MTLDTVEEKTQGQVAIRIPPYDWREYIDKRIAKCRNGSKKQRKLLAMKARIEAREAALETDEPDDTPDNTPDDDSSATLAQFIEEWQDSITSRVIETYRPQYQPQEDDQPLPPVRREPMGNQEQIIRGACLSLKTNRGTTIVGEMGTGKTYLGIVSTYMAGYKRVLVLCPPHLVQKWKREVEMTLPSNLAVAVIVTSITDLRNLQDWYPVSKSDDRAVFVIMSREKAKLSYQWESVAHWGLPIVKDEKTPYCPDCSQQLVDSNGVPLSAKNVRESRRRLKCLNVIDEGQETERVCGAQLWQAHNGGRKKSRIGLAEYIQKKMRHYFDCFVADEVHEYKAKHSAQGIAAAALANVAKRVLVLTGTLMGGYSSTLFFLLYRFYPEFRERFQYTEESMWIQRYGFYEETIKFEEGERVTEHGRTSRRVGAQKKTTKEKPGLLPAALFHLIENCLFVRLPDVADALPPYDEHIVTVPMDEGADDTGWSQRSAYERLYQELYAAMVEALINGSQRLLATYLQTLLAFPDGCTKGEAVYDPLRRELIVAVPPLDSERSYPKEQELLKLVLAERQAGRRVLVYCTHTDTRDITGRLQDALERNGLRVAVLKSGSPASDKREEWVAQRVRQGIDVLICNPRLVQTGLDLIDFPTIVWYETEYSVYTMRQASRRSWRIGQFEPVKVYYMTYEDCLQAQALSLVAAKMQTSLAVEGELPEEGLSAYGQSADNLMITLARQITGRMRSDTPTAAEIKAQFDRTKRVENAGEARLVSNPDSWQKTVSTPVVEPTERKREDTPPKPPKVREPKKPKPTPAPALAPLASGQLPMFSFEEYQR